MTSIGLQTSIMVQRDDRFMLAKYIIVVTEGSSATGYIGTGGLWRLTL